MATATLASNAAFEEPLKIASVCTHNPRSPQYASETWPAQSHVAFAFVQAGLDKRVTNTECLSDATLAHGASPFVVLALRF